MFQKNTKINVKKVIHSKKVPHMTFLHQLSY